MEPRYVIFDLDDTLVHSDAVREAFACVARDRGIDTQRMVETLDELPGRPASEIFEALGCTEQEAINCADRFLPRPPGRPQWRAPDRRLCRRGPDPARPGQELDPDALDGQQPRLRAQQVLRQEGWDAFSVVLGSDETCRKGSAHYAQIAEHAPDPEWVANAVTIGDSPTDMLLGVEHGVPVRIGVDRSGDPWKLINAGATHVVRSLRDVLTIIAV